MEIPGLWPSLVYDAKVVYSLCVYLHFFFLLFQFGKKQDKSKFQFCKLLNVSGICITLLFQHLSNSLVDLCGILGYNMTFR